MDGFLPLKKAMTFVDKQRAVQADVLGYQDILYRTCCMLCCCLRFVFAFTFNCEDCFLGFASAGRHFHSHSISHSQLLYKRPSMQFAAPEAVQHEDAQLLPAAAATTRDEIVVVVDPFSTGAMLVHQLNCAGYQVVCLLSRNLGKLLNMIAEGEWRAVFFAILFSARCSAGRGIFNKQA